MNNLGGTFIQMFLNKNKIHTDELMEIEGEGKIDICYICRCQLRTGCYIVKLACNHKLHSECIERSFAQHFPHQCPNCNKFINFYSIFNLTETDEQKSSFTKLHYYLLLLPYRPSKYYPMNYLMKKRSGPVIFLDVFLSTLGIIILIFIAGFTDQQTICVLANSFIFLIVFKMLAYLISRDYYVTKEDLNFLWTDKKMFMLETYVCANILYHFSLIWIIFMLTLSILIIISIFDTLAIPEYIFLGFLIYEGILDILFHCAPIHVFCTTVTIIYDIIVIFPITLYQMDS